MPKPLLLIVDGESLRTPGLVTAMEGDGWEARWIRSAEAQAFLDLARDPDLLLLEASTPGGAGYALAQRLQERRPGLPVLVLSETSAPGPDPQGQAVAIQAYLERTQPGDALAQALRKYRPEEAKLSRDDIFGDLLQ
ncbi:MAG: response regulator, partial [Geothrix sp.]|nr:response regulator [Geothrix sp.]